MSLSEAQKKKRDEIAEALKADPNFSPIEGRTKEESAFAVATAQVQQENDGDDNPGHNPGIDEPLKRALLEEAQALRESGFMDLEARGLIIQVATERGDIHSVRKALNDVIKLAKEEEIDYAVETYSYLRDSLPKEEHGS